MDHLLRDTLGHRRIDVRLVDALSGHSTRAVDRLRYVCRSRYHSLLSSPVDRGT